MATPTRRLSVLGGGVSGLSLAWFLRRALNASGVKAEITIFESQPRVGGWFETVSRQQQEQQQQTSTSSEHSGVLGRSNDGFLLERGPHSFRPRGTNGLHVLSLIQELGLSQQTRGTSNNSKDRLVWTKEHGIEALPSSLMGLFQSRLTKRLPMLALREMTILPAPAGFDESLLDFFSRRFSSEVALDLVSAMTAGIYAGDVRQLSLRSCFPILYDLEQNHGSIVRGILSEAFLPSAKQAAAHRESLADTAKHLRDPLKEPLDALTSAAGVSFVDGMSTLTNTLREKLEHKNPENSSVSVNFQENSVVQNVDQAGVVTYKNQISGKTAAIQFDHVFSTLPAYELLNVLRGNGKVNGSDDDTSELARMCDELPFVDVAVVNLAYRDLDSLPLAGFGHLVPDSSQHKDGVLGVIYDSVVFPDQRPISLPHGSWVTVMMGGALGADRIRNKNENELVAMARGALDKHLGITGEPSAALAVVHRSCIPQYSVGHFDRVRRAKAQLKEKRPCMTALGNSFGGVGITDCVGNAAKAAVEFEKSLLA